MIKKKIAELGGNQSEVARRVGISSQLLGKYVNGSEPGITFALAWKNAFGENLIETGVSRETIISDHPHTAKLIQILENRMVEEKRILEKHNDFLQDIVKTNLTGLATGQRLIRAQVRAIHQWDAHMAAKGDRKKEDALLKQMGKRINDNFLESHEGDNIAESGN
jgi:transcriptional regulator with XRE-family HTH domain